MIPVGVAFRLALRPGCAGSAASMIGPRGPAYTDGLATGPSGSGDEGLYANTFFEGKAWERSADVEWLDPGAPFAWQAGACVRINGGRSRYPSA